jgi:hypothetical protein
MTISLSDAWSSTFAEASAVFCPSMAGDHPVIDVDAVIMT